MQQNNIRTYSSTPNLVEKRRAEIAENAIKLFIKKGYLKTTTREIAKACHMSTGALYHYIGTKEDILFILSEYAFSILQDITENSLKNSENISPREKLIIAIKKYLERINESQDMLLFWYQESKNLPRDALNNIFSIDELSMKIIENILLEGCKCGDFNIRNPKLAANNIILLCDNWVYRRWILKRLFSIDQFIEEQLDFILRAISDGRIA